MNDQVNRFEHDGKTYIRQNITGCSCYGCALYNGTEGQIFYAEPDKGDCLLARPEGLMFEGDPVFCCPLDERYPFSIFVEELT